MEIKKEIIKLLKEDLEFRNEMKYILNITEIENELEDIEIKMKNHLKLEIHK